MKKRKKGKVNSGSSRGASSPDGVGLVAPLLVMEPRAQAPRSHVRLRSERLPEEAASAVTKYQELYTLARVAGTDGRVQLDGERFAQLLADTGVGVLAEQELYTLALLAAADGHASLVREDVLAALRKAS